MNVNQNPSSSDTYSPYQAPSTNPSATYQAEVSALSLDILRRTRVWVRLLSVLGFVGLALMFLGGLALIMTMSSRNNYWYSSNLGVGVVYLVSIILYLYPIIKLSQFASSITHLLASQSVVSLEAALNHQRAFWKYCGIIALLLIVFYILAIISAVA